MQWRILFSSLVDKIEHTEAFELVEEEVANPEDKVPKKRYSQMRAYLNDIS